MENDETGYTEGSIEDLFDHNSVDWHSDDFKLPDKKGAIVFFNGINHKIALPFDFDQDQIAKCIDLIYTDFDFFDVESLKEIIATSKDHDEFRKLVAQYFYQNLLDRMYELFGELTAKAVWQGLDKVRATKKMSEGKEQYIKDKRKLTEEIKRLMSERSTYGRGRKSGSGTFSDKSELEAAIKSVIKDIESEFDREATEKEILEKLRYHKPSGRPKKDRNPVTLRTVNNSLKRLEVDLKTVIEEYRKSSNQGK